MSLNQDVSQPQGQFAIARIYVKDLSFEAPNVPNIFQLPWEPNVGLDLNANHQKLDNNLYEVTLSVTVTVKTKDQTAFLIEVKQAGIFNIEGLDSVQMDHVLGSFCPNILFPYAREVISSQSVRASFPPLTLSPINFDALYMQQQQERQAAVVN